MGKVPERPSMEEESPMANPIIKLIRQPKSIENSPALLNLKLDIGTIEEKRMALIMPNKKAEHAAIYELAKYCVDAMQGEDCAKNLNSKEELLRDEQFILELKRKFLKVAKPA